MRTARRVLAWWWLAFGAAGIIWYVLPTDFVIRPIATIVNPVTGMVIFQRRTPFGDIQARWLSEITVPIPGDDPVECNSGAWQTTVYQVEPTNSVRYRIGAWADDCLHLGHTFVLRNTRQAMLGGWFPMRASVEEVTVIWPGDGLPYEGRF